MRGWPPYVSCKDSKHHLAQLTKLAAPDAVAYNRSMSRNPFVPSKNQVTEFGFGEGMFPDPNIDFSNNGQKSGFPIADPDTDKQLLMLMAGRRTDLNNPSVPDMPPSGAGGHPDFYTLGNTDRYGAAPPLVRSRLRPKTSPVKPEPPHKMIRAW